MSRVVAADRAALEEAARLLRAGGVVAFPTETVYGLGACATDARAVKRIFAVKGRPPDNPLIVHVSDLDQVRALVRHFGSVACRLAEAFWPGPLALVLERAHGVPDVITAGLPTVAIRMPEHPVALALLRLTGPLAAPSANRSGSPSPTRAEHVVDDLGDAVELVLDGGSCRVGIESTVLDLTLDPPMVLRPGGVTVEVLRSVIGDVQLHATVDDPRHDSDARAPGMRHRHYSPRAELILVEGDHERAVARARDLVDERPGAVLLGVHVHLLGRRGHDFSSVAVAAHGLFAALRDADAAGAPRIVVVGVDAEGLGRSLMNRLRKAASRIELA